MTHPNSSPTSAAPSGKAVDKEAPKAGRGNRQPGEGDFASPNPVDHGRQPAPGGLRQASVDLTSVDPSSAPSLPHDRDEKSGMTGGIPSRRVEQAFDDVEAGRQDTSRGLETDRAYRQQKQSDR